ncbi:MAGUK p55 subfamily member 7 [Ctenopharyngodon idella]|uniref:MAGUK p55 subfamily member 7 n=1 Tax=Ctenopharyngodon idella TaxID=7959 RepID=UPI00222FFD02|nr:MAGUK p55 subfamily member 7 [Ctenopharyngodon idella]
MFYICVAVLSVYLLSFPVDFYIKTVSFDSHLVVFICCLISSPNHRMMINPSSGPGGVCRLLASLLYGLESHMNTSEDSTFLQDMLMGNTLHLLIKVYDRLQKYKAQQPAPLLDSIRGLAQDLAEELHGVVTSPETTELLYLLSKPHVQAFLSVHDMVAQKEFDPRLPPLPPLPDYDEKEEDSVKIVCLVKNQEPLGATIKRDESTGAIIVARVMRGGAADRSGLIHEGDKLKEVNGVPVEDKNPEEIIPILAQSEGAVTFKVIPGTKEELETIDTKIFVRALFDYDPQADPAIPCKDAGLEFHRGDVLQIVSLEDDTWWQARQYGNANLRAGLIPSRQLQERRPEPENSDPETILPPAMIVSPIQWTINQQISEANSSEPAPPGGPEGLLYIPPAHYPGDDAVPHPPDIAEEENIYRVRAVLDSQRQGPMLEYLIDWEDYGPEESGLRRSFRLSRKDNTSQQVRQKMGEAHAAIHFPVYQEVLPHQRKPEEPHRLVLLTGPIGVGVTELKRRLLLSDPEHFSVTVPHTTRERKKQEREGVEYHFVSKHTFEKDILNHKFLEYGEHKGNYYGMSLDSVRRVMAESKVCLLDVEPHTIAALYSSEFKPYIVFVKPPSIERLRLSRRKAKVLASQNEQTATKFFTEEDFQDMITTAQAMEYKYGHLFEKVIINDDLAMAFTELRDELTKIETETHWIPNTWAHV